MSSDPSAGAYGRRAEALASGLHSRKGCFGGVGKEDPLRQGSARRACFGEVSPKTQKEPRLAGRGAPRLTDRRRPLWQVYGWLGVRSQYSMERQCLGGVSFGPSLVVCWKMHFGQV
ncbi:MAG: hypothetical protein OEY86_17535 [Nitrospira sp.]|nr:hypothetical protein [Nitrospira sp.]